MRINISNILNIKHLRNLRNNKYLRDLQDNKYLRDLQNNKYLRNLQNIKNLPKVAMEGLRLKKTTNNHLDENKKLNNTVPAEIFLNQLERECLKHKALRHPLLDELSKGQPDISTIKVFAEQYYYYMRNSSRYFAAVLWACPNEHARALFVKILFEECGGSFAKNRGIDLKFSHPAMFRMFLKAAGVDTSPERLETIKPFTETKLFVEKYFNLVNAHYISALGALAIGTVYIATPLFIQIYYGCKNLGFSDNDVLFFSEQIDMDREHYEDVRKALMPFANTYENQILIRNGVMDVLDARVVFWDAIERASKIRKFSNMVSTSNSNNNVVGQKRTTPREKKTKEKGEANDAPKQQDKIKKKE